MKVIRLSLNDVEKFPASRFDRMRTLQVNPCLLWALVCLAGSVAFSELFTAFISWSGFR
jgi:hypothetical protein